jgi:hypothetical protein
MKELRGIGRKRGLDKICAKLGKQKILAQEVGSRSFPRLERRETWGTLLSSIAIRYDFSWDNCFFTSAAWL